MTLNLLYTFVVCVALLFTVANCQLFEDDLCTSENGLRGVCRQIGHCVEAKERIKNKAKPTICSFIQALPVVCCHDNHQESVQPVQSGQDNFGQGQQGQDNFGQGQGQDNFGQGQGQQGQDNFGQGQQGQDNFGQGQGQDNFGQGQQGQDNFGQGQQGQDNFGQGGMETFEQPAQEVVPQDEFISTEPPRRKTTNWWIKKKTTPAPF